MRSILAILDTGGRSLSYFLGTLVVVLAAAGMLSSMDFAEIANWSLEAVGATFLVMLGGLIFLCLFCWSRMGLIPERRAERRVWLEAGLHAANGIATLGLTYTLLGISLGIGSLAHQGLSPETVQVVIRELTDHFSLAFLTTVIGLPTSAAMRALLLVTEALREAGESRAGAHNEGGPR